MFSKRNNANYFKSICICICICHSLGSRGQRKPKCPLLISHQLPLLLHPLQGQLRSPISDLLQRWKHYESAENVHFPKLGLSALHWPGGKWKFLEEWRQCVLWKMIWSSLRRDAKPKVKRLLSHLKPATMKASMSFWDGEESPSGG